MHNDHSQGIKNRDKFISLESKNYSKCDHMLKYNKLIQILYLKHDTCSQR